MIAGFCHGLTYLTILIHACEVADKRVRGLVVSSIHVCLVAGIITHCGSLQQTEAIREGITDPNRSLGFNGLIFIFIGILLIIFFEKVCVPRILNNPPNKSLKNSRNPQFS
jgi:hypothetical protein